jgi:solute carrier family 45 protein 1/2/4
LRLRIVNPEPFLNFHKSPYAGPNTNPDENHHMATFSQYLWSIVYMPSSLRILCLTNLFCWMSLVCYSLYFTDFVGEAVFGGDPSVKKT